MAQISGYWFAAIIFGVWGAGSLGYLAVLCHLDKAPAITWGDILAAPFASPLVIFFSAFMVAASPILLITWIGRKIKKATLHRFPQLRGIRVFPEPPNWVRRELFSCKTAHKKLAFWQ